jgi:hypothetical protein
MEQQTLIILGIAGFILFHKQILKLLGIGNNPNQQTLWIDKELGKLRDNINDLEKSFLESHSSNYDNEMSILRKSLSTINVNLNKLIRSNNYLNNELSVLKQKSVDIQPKQRLPPVPAKVKIPIDTMKDIIQFRRIGMSLGKISKRTGIPKTSLHRIVQKLKARSKEKDNMQPNERTSYIG